MLRSGFRRLRSPCRTDACDAHARTSSRTHRPRLVECWETLWLGAPESVRARRRVRPGNRRDREDLVGQETKRDSFTCSDELFSPGPRAAGLRISVVE